MTTAAQATAAALEPNAQEPLAYHSARAARFDAEAQRHAARERRLGALRLSLFIAAGVVLSAGLSRADESQMWLGAGLCLAFLLSWLYRATPAHDAAVVRRDLHRRHVMRLSGTWTELTSRGEGLLPPSHDYAADIDLVGPGSLFQRIDVSQTEAGERILAQWLAAPAEPETIIARQQAVAELAANVELRQELEAAALRGAHEGRLDGRSFAEFAALPSHFERHAWLRPVSLVLPVLTVGSLFGFLYGPLSSAVLSLLLIAQLGLLAFSASAIRACFNLAAARQGVVESFEHMLRVVEKARFSSPHLQALQQRLMAAGEPPSAHMASLRTWASLAELRRQFLLYIFINPLTLWDLHVLHGLEAWNRRAGARTRVWFETLGELEALSSLAALQHGDPDCTVPEIAPSDAALSATGLAHPLLKPGARVGNDVQLWGPSSALIVTGSNMAGKSTLLRALGLNVALALCGGPVCARSLCVPRLRLRASMRIDDSLQQGASYFHAELTKLRRVVADAEAEPPILFLLDELLRGTNAHARHLGARSVLLHLIERRATGVVATHDVALSQLEREHPGRVRNVHFTDVVVDGEMRFDYRLRPGVVRTSNALRLLALAGIDVPPEDHASITQAMAQAAEGLTGDAQDEAHSQR